GGQERRLRHREGDVGAGGEGTRREARAWRHAGRDVHHLLARWDRRHLFHADHQRAGGRHPRRLPRADAAGVERIGVQPPPDPAALALLGSPGRGRRGRGAVQYRPRRTAGRRPQDAALMEVRVPDIGDFKDVPIIAVLVKAGDRIEQEQPIVTLESDKATVDVPAPAAGTVSEVRVKVGDKVSEGAVLLILETGEQSKAPASEKKLAAPEPRKGREEPRARPPSDETRRPEAAEVRPPSAAGAV